jgi:AraC-like DNA-binding protein
LIRLYVIGRKTWNCQNDKQVTLELLYKPGDANDKGKLLPIPSHLKRFLVPWATSFYYEYPFGNSLIQEFNTRKFRVYFWRIHIDQSANLYPTCKQPTIAIQAMLVGEIPCTLVGFGEKILKNLRYELFYVPVSINEARLKLGDYQSFHIELEPGFLDEIAETYSLARELLRRFIAVSTYGTPMVSVNIGYVAAAIIKNICSCKKTGGELVIALHRYLVDLLSEYVAGITEQEKVENGKRVPHKDILVRIKDEILANPNVATQTLKKLSARYGISVTEIKESFKIISGNSPGAFIRFHALSKAYYLISTTTQSIDDILDEVGYGYRSNFDKSFKKQFDVLPASLRKRK